MQTARLQCLLAELPTLPEVTGLRMSDILTLPEETRQIVQWLLRKKGAALPELQDFLALPEQELLVMLELWVERGYLKKVTLQGRSYYRVRTHSAANRRKSQLPALWQAIEEQED